jgi:hypothetical protein
MGYQVIITMSELTFTQTKAIKEYCTNFPHRIHPAGETQYSFSGRSIFLLKHPSPSSCPFAVSIPGHGFHDVADNASNLSEHSPKAFQPSRTS